MKKTKIIRIILLTFCLIIFFATSASAIIPYTTYTYDVGGWMQVSPTAYVPLEIINSQTILESFNKSSDLIKQKYSSQTELVTKPLDTPTDVFVDDLNHVYIADSGNNRVIGLDDKYNFRLMLSTFTNDQGVPDSLSSPTGVFVTKTEIYVADKDKSRIVIFDKVGNFVDIVPEPASDVMPENSVYKPIALAVDNAGRIYVVSATTNYGVLSLNRDGSFNGFIGPQKVTYNVFQYMWRKFQTAEQIESSERFVATEYNNITIDEDGFIYITTNSINESNVDAAIRSRSKKGDYAPVKKLNPNGSDVMNRNGLWPPSGEIDYLNFATAGFTHVGPSDICDVALGPNGTWSIIDTERSKVFSYDEQGNLLYAFCDEGDQKGNIQKLIGIAYQGTRILLLDGSASSITVYKRTEYGDLVDAAIKNTLDKNYNEAVKYYRGILQRNNNYDSAYVGIGQSLYRNGEYVKAMQYYMDAYETKNYSEAYAAYRKAWIEDNVWVIPLVVIVLIIALVQFFKWAT
ncbi:MAG TPA: hypothetical protein DD733_10800, partial [Clostridiales bacterium]|nr:hypothetical protein [Clostridiales bacterium]